MSLSSSGSDGTHSSSEAVIEDKSYGHPSDSSVNTVRICDVDTPEVWDRAPEIDQESNIPQLKPLEAVLQYVAGYAL